MKQVISFKKYIFSFLLISSIFLSMVGCTDISKNKKAVNTDGTSYDNSKSININESKQTNLISFFGSIGSSNIHMKFNNSDGKVSGSYFYDIYKNDITISGSIENDMNLHLQEFDGNNNKTGNFEGIYVSENRIEGFWYSGDHENILLGQKNPLPFFLQKENTVSNSNSSSNLNWDGVWTRDLSTEHFFSVIEINNSTNESLWFQMNSYNGVNVGHVMDIAGIYNNEAVFKGIDGAKMVIRLEKERLEITTNDKMSGYAGNGVTFFGTYIKNYKMRKRTYKDYNIFANDFQEEKFKQMVGDHFQSFENSLGAISTYDDKDGLNAKVYNTFVRGTNMNSIIMIGMDNKMWAAVVEEDTIYYFTNLDDKRIPNTIEKWREGKKAEKVIIMNIS